MIGAKKSLPLEVSWAPTVRPPEETLPALGSPPFSGGDWVAVGLALHPNGPPGESRQLFSPVGAEQAQPGPTPPPAITTPTPPPRGQPRYLATWHQGLPATTVRLIPQGPVAGEKVPSPHHPQLPPAREAGSSPVYRLLGIGLNLFCFVF